VNPFEALRRPARRHLTGEKVRSAWRRITAAAHPGRADGGDPGAYAARAGSCTVLQTSADRGAAMADLRGPVGGRVPGYPVPGRKNPLARLAVVVPPPIRHGRPVRLVLRLLAVAATGALAVLSAGWQPASLAVMTGALTWLFCTGRSDLAVERPDEFSPPVAAEVRAGRRH
jgi:hypothetical protein